jgi:hypothetical protein
MSAASPIVTPSENPILESSAGRWLMTPDDEHKESFNPIVAGCGCSKVCNALNDWENEPEK